ncbi:MAG: transcription-repair coupling factor [Clostridiales bacterium]
MGLEYLVNPLLELKEYKNIIDNLNLKDVNIVGPVDSQRAHIVYSICENKNKKALFIASNEFFARKYYNDFTFLFGGNVLLYPLKQVESHKIEAQSHEESHIRISVLDQMLKNNYSIVVTSVEAVLQSIESKDVFLEGKIKVEIGMEYQLDKLIKKLILIGYERVDSVEVKGQFAVRGGILDIFTINNLKPVRIEFFGDEIDSIRLFDEETQRSINNEGSIEIVPSREIFYFNKDEKNIANLILSDLREISDDDVYNEKIYSDIENIKNKIYFSNMDKYLTYFSETGCMLDYLSDEDLIFIDEKYRLKNSVDNIYSEQFDIINNYFGRTLKSLREKSIYISYDELVYKFDKYRTINIDSLDNSKNYDQKHSIDTLSINPFEGRFDVLFKEIKRWKKERKRVIILVGSKLKGEKICEELINEDIESSYIEDCKNDIEPGQIIITRGFLNKGFEYPDIGFVVVSDNDILSVKKEKRKQLKSDNYHKIKTFVDLKIGDFVVHQSHGIGIYNGINTLEVDGQKKDFLKIRYKDDGYLYIPTNQLDLIQKYIGSEGKTPKVSKLGGNDWIKAKRRVKESLRTLADELIKLYALRRNKKGFAFSRDSVWQSQFEDYFIYEETEEQLICTEEIKRDMEEDKPMDRLLCGDVGYGKTEVALRAIFKAVTDGKQVAYLVPTTILAQQHYTSFKERLKEFPVNIEVISRFKTKTQQKAILIELSKGSIDILIGTHRLFQNDVKFKDLGLLIVDEEQRFGVSHKEKIKNLKPNIDVLTLSATPIPRTLHMSLVGIRDISTIENPPKGRYPVKTYVLEYEEETIKDAIYRELSRKGQIYYLFNNVKSINLKLAEISKLVPDARVSYAHGQMSERELEKIMTSFLERKFDILICTTIIESGLDMPNVNTIIVENSDRLGLSQLYQIRGRVGRSDKIAYAYITYRKDKILSELSEKRLKAIKEFTEFGSGFKIAMRDLEIRGAGNILGYEQHGQMDAIGYDMYCKLLSQVIKEQKGEVCEDDENEVVVDLKFSAYINDRYISDEEQKIEMYKKISSIHKEEDISDIEDEFTDRFGGINEDVSNLILISYIKNTAYKCGFNAVLEKNNYIWFQYSNINKVNLNEVGKIMNIEKGKLLFNAGKSPYISYNISKINRKNVLNNIKKILQEINKLKNNDE